MSAERSDSGFFYTTKYYYHYENCRPRGEIYVQYIHVWPDIISHYRGYPDRKSLEAQCISCISFVRDYADVLQVPVWVMVINIVALDMLKSKLPRK